jgi:hypothetical protein
MGERLCWGIGTESLNAHRSLPDFGLCFGAFRAHMQNALQCPPLVLGTALGLKGYLPMHDSCSNASRLLQ